MVLKKSKFLRSMIFRKKKVFRKHDFEKQLHKKSRFGSIYPVKSASFAFYVHFQKARV